MNEKEKKAIEILKEIEINTYAEGKAIAIDTVLKLIKKLQKENEELKNNTRKNKNELEFDVDADWTTLQKILDESEKSNEYISYKNEKWIKEKYCIPIQKVKDIQKEKEWALERYDCDEADYKQSQAIGAWSVLQKLIEEREEK